MQALHDLGARRTVQLALELVEEHHAISMRLVAEIVHEPGEAVDRPQVRPRVPRREYRDDREVLPARPSVDALRRQLWRFEKTRRGHGPP